MEPVAATPKLPIRLVPRAGTALAIALFAALFLAFALFGSNLGAVRVNGVVVAGAERGHAVFMMKLFIVPLLVGLVVSEGRRALPDSPFDYLEVAADGTIVKGLLHARYVAWRDIASFSSGRASFWNVRPSAWITIHFNSAVSGTYPTANGEHDRLRLWVGSYIYGLFGGSDAQLREFTEWLSAVKNVLVAQAMDVAALPPVPHFLAEQVIDLHPETRYANAAGTRV